MSKRLKAYFMRALLPSQLGISFLAIVAGITVLQVRPWLIVSAKKIAATVDVAGRAMTNLDAASKSLKKASEDESSYLNTALPQLTARINGVISDLRGTTGKLADVADSANQVLISAKADTDDVDAFIKSPDLANTMHHVNDVTDHADGITEDMQVKFHDLLYPKQCIGRWCWAKRAWQAIEAGHDIPEMTYWLEQVFTH